MQRNLLPITKKIKAWIQERKVNDVILFGSTVRGKSEPNDLDLCILIDDHDEERSIDLVHSLSELTDKSPLKCQVNILTLSALVGGDTLGKVLLFEGFSIRKNKELAEVLGLSNKSLFIYALKNFDPSKRVMFHYLLQGRYGAKGILSEVKGVLLGRGSILVPSSKEDALKEIFDKWKVQYKVERLLFS